MAEAQLGATRGGDRLFALIDDTQACYLLADVSGNGPSAASAADALAVFVAALPAELPDPASVLRILHTRLCQHWASDPIGSDYWFVDALAVRLDLRSGTAEAASGGSPHVWVSDPDGWAKWDIPSGGLLGVPTPGTEFASKSRQMSAGGMLFAATDGLSDACNSDGPFGADGVGRALNGCRVGSEPSQVVGAVLAAVRAFAVKPWPSSDVTAMCFGW